jgi:hypothetical protein
VFDGGAEVSPQDFEKKNTANAPTLKFIGLANSLLGHPKLANYVCKNINKHVLKSIGFLL